MINHVIRSSSALLKLASTLDGSHLLSRLVDFETIPIERDTLSVLSFCSFNRLRAH
jgi:hypothetical protein